MEIDMLETLKLAISSVTQLNYDDFNTTQPLNLDSIQRISLIVALEESFDIEIDSEEMDADVFNSLDSLLTFIKAQS